MKKTTDLVAAYNKTWAKIGIILLIVLAGSILLRMTSLIDYYAINVLTSIIIANSFWIIIIAILLFVANICERLKFEQTKEKEKRNVD
ncbi:MULTISPECIES: hypothetical protein [Erysipelotrichaceae]|jgi:hypothetical protein|uniref:Uncharacterized protein n=1 Tax=Faecalibaculum rodentium TaxID=1702221 RepID=A0A1Q9YHF1_9FIRM|nr:MULTISPECIES: hypothetical protein [Erysipelotrichaceae]OLU43581.1 hypothetical protein BO223_11460 [Faecalibaculum rodentium]